MRAEWLDLLTVSSCVMTAAACQLTEMSADRQSIVIQPIVVPLGTHPVCSSWLLES